MSEATCKTCPWLGVSQFGNHPLCRKNPPRFSDHPNSPDGTGYWPTVVELTDWCGEHPDRQPRLECATATLVTHNDDGPSAADMRRIVDALEKMATCAAVKP